MATPADLTARALDQLGVTTVFTDPYNVVAMVLANLIATGEYVPVDDEATVGVPEIAE